MCEKSLLFVTGPNPGVSVKGKSLCWVYSIAVAGASWGKANTREFSDWDHLH